MQCLRYSVTVTYCFIYYIWIVDNTVCQETIDIISNMLANDHV